MKQIERILEINLAAVRNNICVIKKLTKTKILCCLKCDAYGMGAKRISKEIEDITDYFGVATIEEAISLRKIGIKKPILVLGPVIKNAIKKAIEYRISITAASLPFINEISSASNLSIHIKVDTGMGRIGIMPEELSNAIEVLKKAKVRVEGIFSHFSDSENPDRKNSLKQIEVFKDALSSIPAKFRGLTHIANSGGIVNVPESYQGFSMVRTGLLLYGVYQSLFLRIFKPLENIHYALKGITNVLLVRVVPAGTKISYGGTYVCQSETKIAIAAIGYGDGLDRRLSNKFFMKQNGDLFKIIGRICMDQTLLEVDDSVKVGRQQI